MTRMIESCATTPFVASRPARRPLTEILLTTVAAIAGTVYRWQTRLAERQHLRALDDRLLADMGLSRADVEREVGKPFWRD